MDVYTFLNSLVECYSCSKQLNASHKMLLPCQHVLCLDCLDPKVNENRVVVCCPGCNRYVNKMLSELSNSSMVMRIFEYMKQSMVPQPMVQQATINIPKNPQETVYSYQPTSSEFMVPPPPTNIPRNSQETVHRYQPCSLEYVVPPPPTNILRNPQQQEVYRYQPTNSAFMVLPTPINNPINQMARHQQQMAEFFQAANPQNLMVQPETMQISPYQQVIVQPSSLEQSNPKETFYSEL